MTISREQIINHIVSSLEKEDCILALWLEGSDGTGSVDEHSDIDLVCYTKEGFGDEAIARLNGCLHRLAAVDFAYEQPGRPANNRYFVCHLEGTPDSLLLDATVQNESHPVSFLKEDKMVVPVVLFDKAGIVRFQSMEPEERRAQLQAQLDHALALYSQRSRAVKYTNRGLFLESLIYYQKYILGPLVDVLRIVHTPLQADCFLVHATRDFPTQVTAKLEHLYGVMTVQDIAGRILPADEMFRSAAAEAQERLTREAFQS